MKIYQAINKVQAALAAEGISKDKTNNQQGYKFRGIDDVYNAIAPLLAQNGLCILPRMLSRECQERQSSNGKPVFYVVVEAEFDFIAAEDGSKHTVKTYGEAMDSADKATNKAMSAAYKYAAFQAFAIPTEGDNDADLNTPDAGKAKTDSKPKNNASSKTNQQPQQQQPTQQVDLGKVAEGLIKSIKNTKTTESFFNFFNQRETYKTKVSEADYKIICREFQEHAASFNLEWDKHENTWVTIDPYQNQSSQSATH